MKTMILLITIVCFISGCNNSIENKMNVITIGMPYSEASALLSKNGFKEESSEWDMVIPEEIKLHTFFIEESTALLIDEYKQDGKIVGIEIYNNCNRPKIYRTSRTIKEFKIPTK